MAVMLHFDLHLAWKKRPDLWNWFDPHKPGYNPDNQLNVEWHGWSGPPNKVHYLNHGVLERRPPSMCLTSRRTRAEVTRIVSKVIGPSFARNSPDSKRTARKSSSRESWWAWSRASTTTQNPIPSSRR